MQTSDNQLDGGNPNRRDFNSSVSLLGDTWSPGTKNTFVPQETSASNFVPPLSLTGFSESVEIPREAQPPVENPVVSNAQLVQQLGSNSFRQRETAMRELQDRGLCALPELLHAHGNDDLEISRRADQLIDRIGSSGLPFMTAALDSNDAHLRAGAERAVGRLSLQSILDYAAEDNDPVRLQESQRALRGRQGWQDEVSALISRDSENGRFGPRNAQEYRRAIAGARLLDNQPYVFHLSLDEGRFLLGSGDHQGALSSLDLSLNTLSTRLREDPASVLFAVDFQQQLRDHLESPAGQQLPESVRTAVNQRIERARALQEKIQSRQNQDS